MADLATQHHTAGSHRVSPPKPVWAVLANSAPLWLGGWLAAAALLAAPTGDLQPIRALLPELRALAICYPLGLVMTLRHVRARAPELLRRVPAMFVLAFVLRVGVLCALTHHRAVGAPATLGNGGHDSVIFGVISRGYAMQITRQDYNLHNDIGRLLSEPSLSVAVSNQVTKIIDPVSLWVLLGGWIALVGYSVPAVVMPFVAFGSFWAIQVWVYFHRRGHARVGDRLVKWMVLAPEFVLQSCWLHKDVLTGVVLVAALELSEGRRGRHWLRHALTTAVLLVLAWSVRREFLAGFLVMTLIYVAVRRAVPGKGRVWADMVAAIAVIGLVPLVDPTMWTRVSLPMYLFGTLASSFLMPGPAVYFAPFFANSPLEALVLLGVVWPFIGGLLLVALLHYRRERFHHLHLALVVSSWYVAFATSSLIKWLLPLRRVAVQPFLLAAALEAWDMIRAERSRKRRVLLRFVLVFGWGLLLLQLLFAWGYYPFR